MKNILLVIGVVFFIFSGCTKKIDTIQVGKPPIKIDEQVVEKTIEQDGEKTLVIETAIDTDKTLPQVYQEEKIAVVFASKVVGRYGNDAVNTIIAYSMYKEIDFEIKVFDSLYENKNHIEDIFYEIEKEGFKNVIAVFAYDNTLEYISNIDKFKIYIPTLNVNNSILKSPNVLFGGIDYDEQYKELFKYSNSKVIEIYDAQKISSIYQTYVYQNKIPFLKQYQVTKSNMNYKSLFENNSIIEESSLFLNTTLLQSAIVLSQLRVYDTKPYVILSTQLNYNPMILSLSQFEDRKNMLIANSIGTVKPAIKAISELLGSDLSYNWVNFSTIVGIQEFLFRNSKDIQNYHIKNNQIHYDITVFKPAQFSFVKVTNNTID